MQIHRHLPHMAPQKMINKNKSSRNWAKDAKKGERLMIPSPL
jgi:hypothetical protein